MKNKTSTEETKPEPAYPLGRWSSVETKTEILRYMLQADEIKRAALDQLAKQQAADALPTLTLIRRAA